MPGSWVGLARLVENYKSPPSVVGEDFVCKFLPDLIKLESPGQLNFYADQPVLVDLMRSGIAWKDHSCTCCTDAMQARAAVVPHSPCQPAHATWYLVLRMTLPGVDLLGCPGTTDGRRPSPNVSPSLCSAAPCSVLAQNGSHNNVPSENAQTSTSIGDQTIHS